MVYASGAIAERLTEWRPGRGGGGGKVGEEKVRGRLSIVGLTGDSLRPFFDGFVIEGRCFFGERTGRGGGGGNLETGAGQKGFVVGCWRVPLLLLLVETGERRLESREGSDLVLVLSVAANEGFTSGGEERSGKISNGDSRPTRKKNSLG